ncbi:MAG: TlyA family RNA methyltransferase [Verrucomicrobiaceae bacterium]|nr:TlyA family RNA methyltransferase [Verrucomicrobiaceae bacterium]
MAKLRLDQAVVQRGLCESREQAKRLILAGQVLLNGQPSTKPGMAIPEDGIVTVKEMPRFVSRGGLKLEGALAHFGIDVAGGVALDIGASTGGFTDCLLQHGVVKVYAFDVGTNQLVWKLRNDPRVVSREHFNVRHMVAADVPEMVDVVVADVSFISLTLVLPPGIEVLKPGGNAVVLVKPQFELSREEVGKGGIVRDPAAHAKACERIESFVRARPELQWRGLVESSIQGTDGNREFLAWFTKA